MFDEITEVKRSKEMEALKSLHLKAEVYLETKRASRMKLFC